MLTKPNILGYYGSYLYVRYGGLSFVDIPNEKKNKVVICTSRGTGAKSPNCFVIDTDDNGKTEFTFNKFSYQDSKNTLAITYADEDTLLLEGRGKFSLDEMPAGFTDNGVYFKNSKGKYFVINVYRNKTKYLVYATKGNLSLEKNICGNEYAKSSKDLILKLNIDSDDGFKVVIKEMHHYMSPFELIDYDFDDCAKAMLDKFNKWYEPFEKPSKELSEVHRLAAYYNWAETLRPSGYITRDFVKCTNYLTSNWCSDIVLNATGLMKAHPKLAFDQIAVFFDNQDEYGCIPGSMNDEQLSWNISKAPFVGSYIKDIMKHYDASKEEELYIYNHLSKLVDFYFTYKDSNQDGICEYMHGNESDCDNSSCYEDFDVIDSPELTAYLVNAMDYLAELGNKLGVENTWKIRADEVSKKAIDYFFVDGKIVCRFTNTGEVKDSDSAMPLYFLLMGDRLPKEKLERVVEYIEENFVGEYGVSTEGYNSDKWGTVFRGPTYIHAQLLIDGLDRCGYHELAAKIARGYVKGIIEGETFDQFDARTLERTCMICKDMMVSTVAAVFMYLYNKYCKE